MQITLNVNFRLDSDSREFLEKLLDKVGQDKVSTQTPEVEAPSENIQPEVPSVPVETRKHFGGRQPSEPLEDGFPVSWKAVASRLIDKHVVFGFNDLTPKQVQGAYRKPFLDWLKTQNCEISQELGKLGKPYVFTPYYMNGRVKVLASNDPKTKIPTAGARSSYTVNGAGPLDKLVANEERLVS